MPSTSLHTTTSPHLGCTSVICMQLTGEQSHAAFGISDPPRNGSRADTPQNAAGPRHPLLGSSQHRCHEAGMQTARPKCKLHHRGRGGKKSKGGEKSRQRRQLQHFVTCTPAPADPLLRALMQSCAAKLVGLQASEEHAIRRT